MTLGKLIKIMKENNIPDDAILLSDSGWECGETEMDGILYSETLNVVIFKQEMYDDEDGIINTYDHGSASDGVWLEERS